MIYSFIESLFTASLHGVALNIHIEITTEFAAGLIGELMDNLESNISVLDMYNH